MKMHATSLRLLVNAGMRFPECYSRARLLDTVKSALPTTSDHHLVTCKRCMVALGKRYMEALRETFAESLSANPDKKEA